MGSRAARIVLACVFGLSLAAAPRSGHADVHVGIDLFVGALNPYGTWFDYPHYGRVWRPTGVASDWRPYTNGRWVWSDQYGWVWSADEDWGWATYHYGRWLFDSSVGWFWIPGYQWGPAWVRWRYGPSYVGWYPLPPNGVSVGVVPSRWTFVPQRDFFRPHLHDYAFAPDRRVFRASRQEVSLGHRDGRWFNRGLDPHHFERIAHAKAPVVRVADADRPEAAKLMKSERGREELRVYRPDVRKASAAAAAAEADRTRDEKIRAKQSEQDRVRQEKQARQQAREQRIQSQQKQQAEQAQQVEQKRQAEQQQKQQARVARERAAVERGQPKAVEPRIPARERAATKPGRVEGNAERAASPRKAAPTSARTEVERTSHRTAPAPKLARPEPHGGSFGRAPRATPNAAAHASKPSAPPQARAAPHGKAQPRAAAKGQPTEPAAAPRPEPRFGQR